jgi:uncharacterized membrane protein
MVLLIVGLLLWSVPHLMPSVGIGVRKRLIVKLGEGPYSGIVALLILSGIVLIVFGWRSIIPEPVYFPPGYLEPATYVLMFFSLLLFIASGRATRIKQFIRHPQLTGVVLWSVAHLLQAGDDRSILLFGVLALWSVLEMIFINRRDGVWVKAAVPALVEDVKLLVVSAVVYTVAMFAHPYIAGVTLI